MPSFTITRRVEFSDTDMAGIMHFTGYFRFMEAAEHSLLRSLGIELVINGRDEQIGWPRVSAACDYRIPARFGDELQVEAAVQRVGDKSVTYRFVFRHDDQELAAGQMTSVCCRFRPGHPPESVPIPASIREALRS